MKNDVISPEFDENGRAMRRIRSFVRRQGRLTKGQQHALDNFWPVMGVEYQAEPLDIDTLFGRAAPVCAGNRFWHGHVAGDHGAEQPAAELYRH